MVLGFVKEAFENVITLVDLSSIPVEHKTNDADLLFTDRGNRVTFDRVRVSDDDRGRSLGPVSFIKLSN